MDFMRFDDGCGRYGLAATRKELKERYDLANEPPEFSSSYDIRPSQTNPVVIAGDDGKPRLEMMKWGLIPSFWAKDKKLPFSTFNARDDRVFQSGLWRSVYKRRALVPATGILNGRKFQRALKSRNASFIFTLNN